MTIVVHKNIEPPVRLYGLQHRSLCGFFIAVPPGVTIEALANGELVR